MTELFSPASQTTLNSPVRDCYVSNPYPCYRSPTPDAAKPAIVKALVKAAQNSNPARHEAWYTTPRLDVKTGLKKPFIKRMNAHRARAVNALMVAMADRLNIVSGKVEANVEQLFTRQPGADDAGRAGRHQMRTRLGRQHTFLYPQDYLGHRAVLCAYRLRGG